MQESPTKRPGPNKLLRWVEKRIQSTEELIAMSKSIKSQNYVPPENRTSNNHAMMTNVKQSNHSGLRLVRLVPSKFGFFGSSARSVLRSLRLRAG